MNYLKKIILFFLIGISVNCKEIARINNNIRDDKNRLNMEIEKDEKIKILKTKQKLSLVSKVYTAPNFIISNYSFLVDKNKIKEFVIKEDKLESYNKEIKTLIQQIEKKMYLSKSISGGINKPNFFVSQPNIYKQEIDSEFIVYLSKDFNYYLDLSKYLNFSKKEVSFEDWFLDIYYYSLNEDLIKLYNLLENNKK